MKLDYENINKEQLEEFIEFVDWTIIPSSFITQELIDKFPSIRAIKARFFIDNIFSRLEVKVDEETYPNLVFFFIGNNWYLYFESYTGNLWCSNERLWSFLEKEYSKKYAEVQLFIKKVVENYYDKKDIMPINIMDIHGGNLIKQNFRDIKSESLSVKDILKDKNIIPGRNVKVTPYLMEQQLNSDQNNEWND